MKCIDQIRRERLIQLLAELKLTLADLNERLGRPRRDATLSQLLNQAANTRTGRARLMGHDQARAIEKAAGLEVGWMDRDPEFDVAKAELLRMQASVTELRAAEPPSVYRLWPFPRLSLARLLRLPADEIRRIEGSMLGLVREWEQQAGLEENDAAA